MPIMLFNPPCPHADPVVSGALQRDGNRCGNCICVPRYWLLTCAAVAGVYYAMGGKFVLSRDVAGFSADVTKDCRWEANIPLNPNPGAPIGVWRLFNDSGPSSGWYVWADMSANLLADIDVYGPNGIDPAAPDFSTTAWNCLSKNTMVLTAPGLGFPATITVEPFWP